MELREKGRRTRAAMAQATEALKGGGISQAGGAVTTVTTAAKSGAIVGGAGGAAAVGGVIGGPSSSTSSSQQNVMHTIDVAPGSALTLRSHRTASHGAAKPPRRHTTKTKPTSTAKAAPQKSSTLRKKGANALDISAPKPLELAPVATDPESPSKAMHATAAAMAADQLRRPTVSERAATRAEHGGKFEPRVEVKDLVDSTMGGNQMQSMLAAAAVAARGTLTPHNNARGGGAVTHDKSSLATTASGAATGTVKATSSSTEASGVSTIPRADSVGVVDGHATKHIPHTQSKESAKATSNRRTKFSRLLGKKKSKESLLDKSAGASHSDGTQSDASARTTSDGQQEEVRGGAAIDWASVVRKEIDGIDTEHLRTDQQTSEADVWAGYLDVTPADVDIDIDIDPSQLLASQDKWRDSAMSAMSSVSAASSIPRGASDDDDGDGPARSRVSVASSASTVGRPSWENDALPNNDSAAAPAEATARPGSFTHFAIPAVDAAAPTEGDDTKGGGAPSEEVVSSPWDIIDAVAAT